MATSGSVSVAATSYDTLKFSWERTGYSIANNTTTISWKLELIAGAYGYISSSASKAWSVTVNGSNYSGSNTIGIANNATKTLASGSTTIGHNADGSKTFSFSFSQQFDINFNGKIGTVSGSGTGILNSIPRQATLTAAPDFNDEGNPTITYSNPAGNAVNSLQACIASADGKTIYAPYRDISKTGSSYTFNLTEAERESLRWATINSNTLTVKFYVTTVIGTTHYYSTLDKILTIANATPTLTAEVTADEATRALTGNNNTLIKYRSNVTAAASYAVLKHANLKSYAVSCGAKAASANPATFEAVESGLFTFAVTDSRGNTNTKTVTKNLIEYVKLSCNLFANNPTAEGVLDFVISGDYFNGSFGAVDNSLTVEYRYKQTSGDYGDWVTATPVLNGNKYEANLTLTGLDYRKAYTLQARAKDEATAYIESVERTVKTIPVFDWGEDDFNFNVPVSFKGDLILSGKLLNADGQDYFDFPIDQGKSNGWNYRKWKSGLAELWLTTEEQEIAISTPWGNMYTKDNAFPGYIYPFEFAELPTVTVYPHTSNGNFWLFTGSGATTKASPSVSLCRPTTYTVSASLSYYIIGKWK